MADESILQYKKPGFPTYSNDGKSHKTEVEYIGPFADLFSAAPNMGAAWGSYPGIVESQSIEPIPGTDLGDLKITVTYSFDQSSVEYSAGEEHETSWELEYVAVQRSMYEHPEFAVGLGGTYALTSEDIAAIEAWKNNENVTEKKVFKYKTTPDAGEYTTLTTNAKMFARGIEMGVETWTDYAPVVRRVKTYRNGGPDLMAAGYKDDPPAGGYAPDSYEYIKTADRALKSGAQNRWERVEEWTGAHKILVDANEILWTAPS